MAHDKVYAICENKCREETLTKAQIEEKFTATNNAVANLNTAIQGQGIRLDDNRDHCNSASTALTDIINNEIAQAQDITALRNAVSGALDIVAGALSNFE